jgi:hypothetical protein
MAHHSTVVSISLSTKWSSCVNGCTVGVSRNAKPIDRNRILETPLVEKADNELMRWVGRGAVTQMYCTFLFAGKLIYDADPTANIYEVSLLQRIVGKSVFSSRWRHTSGELYVRFRFGQQAARWQVHQHACSSARKCSAIKS